MYTKVINSKQVEHFVKLIKLSLTVVLRTKMLFWKSYRFHGEIFKRERSKMMNGKMIKLMWMGIFAENKIKIPKILFRNKEIEIYYINPRHVLDKNGTFSENVAENVLEGSTFLKRSLNFSNFSLKSCRKFPLWVTVINFVF